MSGDARVYGFLDTLLISRKSRYSYVCILRRFETFVHEHAPDRKIVSTKILRAWLTQESGRRPPATMMSQMCLIAHYLEWRAAHGGGPDPFAPLLAKYGRLVTPIVRALL